MGNWGYNLTLLIGVITPLITGRGPPCTKLKFSNLRNLHRKNVPEKSMNLEKKNDAFPQQKWVPEIIRASERSRSSFGWFFSIEKPYLEDHPN